jgi:hypothetical protein
MWKVRRLLVVTMAAALMVGAIGQGTAGAETRNLSASAATTWFGPVSAQTNFIVEDAHDWWLYQNTSALATAKGCVNCRSVAIAISVKVGPVWSAKQTTVARTFQDTCDGCVTDAVAVSYLISTKCSLNYFALGNLYAVKLQLQDLKNSITTSTDGATIGSSIFGLLLQIGFILGDPASYYCPSGQSAVDPNAVSPAGVVNVPVQQHVAWADQPNQQQTAAT